MSAMRRLAPLAATVALAGGAAGCGSSNDLPSDIPADSASGLVSSLNAVVARCQSGTGASRAAVQYQHAVGDLPDSVDPGVRKILEETAANLTNLADRKACSGGATGTSGFQGEQTTSTTPTETTVPPTTTETTTTTTSTHTEPQPRQPQPGSGQNEGSGQQPGPGPQPGAGQGEGQGGPSGGGGSAGGGLGPAPGGGVSPGKSAQKHAAKAPKRHPRHRGGA